MSEPTDRRLTELEWLAKYSEKHVWGAVRSEDILALVAEVRRLRAMGDAVAAEREACASIVIGYRDKETGLSPIFVRQRIAAAIRARSAATAAAEPSSPQTGRTGH